MTPRLFSWEKPTSERGFTLLEVVIALTLLGILVAILTLQFRPLLAQTHLSDATRQMVANLQYVRMKAVSQNRRLRVTFRPANHDYVVDKDENGTWQRQLLHSHTDAEVPDATITLPRDVRIAAVNSGADVIFLPRGAVDGGISITLGTVSGSDTKRVVVNLAGRVRVE
jgi:type IV fimbrial biogenesis protein FimT